MQISRRQLLEIIGAGSIAAALPVALLAKLGGVRTLTSGPARITVTTELEGVGRFLVWEIPYVEFADGLKVEYRELEDAPGDPAIPTLEVREDGMKPWRQVGIVDSMTLSVPVNRPTSLDYGKLEFLDAEEAS